MGTVTGLMEKFDFELEPLVDDAIREDEVWGFRVSKLREERKMIFD